MSIGPVTNLVVTSVSNGFFATWSPPIGYESTPLTYIYQITSFPPTAAIIWNTTPIIGENQYKVTNNTFIPGSTYTIEFWANDGEHTSRSFTPLSPDEIVITAENGVNTNTTSQTVAESIISSFAGGVNVTLDGTANATVTAGASDIAQAGLTGAKEQISKKGQTIVAAAQVSGTSVNGQIIEDTAEATTQIPIPDSIGVGATVDVYELQNQIAVLIATVQSQINSINKVIVQIKKKLRATIYIVAIDTNTGSTVPGILINTDQSYNNALWDSSARTQEKTDYTYATGFFRQPVDNQTITRIRQANARLVGRPGINGQFGSGCCMPIPGEVKYLK